MFYDKNKNVAKREGNIDGRPSINTNKTEETDNRNNSSVPKTSKQKTLLDYHKTKEKTLFDWS